MINIFFFIKFKFLSLICITTNVMLKIPAKFPKSLNRAKTAFTGRPNVVYTMLNCIRDISAEYRIYKFAIAKNSYKIRDTKYYTKTTAKSKRNITKRYFASKFKLFSLKTDLLTKNNNTPCKILR